MKRFTETAKWADPWFRKLTPAQKCLWLYLCDTCDQAGVIDLDLGLASFQIGMRLSEKDLEGLSKGITYLPNGKIWIPDFVRFQYGKLSPECKPHMPVFACLERSGISLEAVSQNERFKEVVPGYMRERIIERDGKVCVYYGTELSRDDIVIDHVIPRSKGGECVPSNLVVSSRRANADKSDLSVEDFCEKVGLSFDEVNQRITERLSKPIQKGFRSLQEKEKDKEEDKEKENAGERDAAEVIYQAYPRKEAKQHALKAIRTALKIKPFDGLLEATQAYASATARWPIEKREYIPHPATWYNRGSYDDDRANWSKHEAQPVMR